MKYFKGTYWNGKFYPRGLFFNRVLTEEEIKRIKEVTQGIGGLAGEDKDE